MENIFRDLDRTYWDRVKAHAYWAFSRWQFSPEVFLWSSRHRDTGSDPGIWKIWAWIASSLAMTDTSESPFYRSNPSCSLLYIRMRLRYSWELCYTQVSRGEGTYLACRGWYCCSIWNSERTRKRTPRSNNSLLLKWKMIWSLLSPCCISRIRRYPNTKIIPNIRDYFGSRRMSLDVVVPTSQRGLWSSERAHARVVRVSIESREYFWGVFTVLRVPRVDRWVSSYWVLKYLGECQ